MKVTVLIENTCRDTSLCAEHGLSLYIETKKHKILFDFGQSERCLENAEKLGICLKDVDMAFLSHGHFDHSGAIAGFLELNQKAPVYMSNYVFEAHYNQDYKYIGVDRSLMGSRRLFFSSGKRKIDDELTILNFNDLKPTHDFLTFGMTKVVDGRCVPDTFHHEQYLLVEEDKKQVLFSGCSHKGVENILTWSQEQGLNLNALVGGFHFFKVSKEEYALLDQAARMLMEQPVQYYTGHCTGTEQYQYLKQIMGDRLTYLSTGVSVEI